MRGPIGNANITKTVAQQKLRKQRINRGISNQAPEHIINFGSQDITSKLNQSNIMNERNSSLQTK
jgi:hypothetical protein